MTGNAIPEAVLKTDPVTFEVVKNSLYAVAEEMKVVLAKTAYSPILKLAGDYSCGVFDVSGNMVAQGLALTGFFLERHVFGPQDRPLPAPRRRLIEHFRIEEP